MRRLSLRKWAKFAQAPTSEGVARDCPSGSDRSSARIGQRRRNRAPSLVELRPSAIAGKIGSLKAAAGMIRTARTARSEDAQEEQQHQRSIAELKRPAAALGLEIELTSVPA